MEANKVVTKSVLVIFWHFFKLIERKLLEDVICSANVFVDERTWTAKRKVTKVKSSYCVVKIAYSTLITGLATQIKSN